MANLNFTVSQINQSLAMPHQPAGYTPTQKQEARENIGVSATTGGYVFKGSVATIQSLPAAGAIGDMYYVQSNAHNYAWNGSSWVDIGSVDSNVVGYYPQSRTEEEKLQAQENIGLHNVLSVHSPFGGSRITANGQPIKDGIASVKSASGYSWVFNQLTNGYSPYRNFSTTDGGETFHYNGQNSDTYIGAGCDSVVGHTYYARFYITMDSGYSDPNMVMGFPSGVENSKPLVVGLNTWIHKETSRARTPMLWDDTQTSTSKFTLSKRRVVDLTIAFGQGNEPTSVDDWRIKLIEQKLAKDGSYNQGEIIDLNGAVKSVGRNLLNPSIDATFVIDDAYRFEKIEADDWFISLIDKDTSVSLNGINFGFSTENEQVSNTGFNWLISNGSLWYRESRNISNNGTKAKYVFIHPNTVESWVTVMSRFYIMVNRGTTALLYEPYTSSTTPMPLLRSAGTVKDSWNNGTVTRKVGSVDLGSLNWTRTAKSNAPSEYKFIAPIPSDCRGSTGNYICVYPSGDVNGAGTDKVCAIGSSINIVDNRYVNADAFKTAMSGVMLNYELATPTTEPFEIPPYSAYLNGTEEIIGDGVLDAEIGYGVDVVKNLMELSDSVNWIFDYLLDNEVRLSMLELFGSED